MKILSLRSSRRALRAAALSVSVLSLGLAACGGAGGSDGAPSSLAEMTDEQILADLQLAFRWGYPLMATNLNNENYGEVRNGFYLMKSMADASSRSSPGFNAEVLYSAGAIDLSEEPLVLTLPPMGERFFVFPLQDAWTNVYDVVGTRTVGNAGGSYLIAGPDWKGEAPDGMKVFRSPTNIGFIPGRTTVSNPADAQAVASTLMDRYTLTPLSRWGSGPANPNRDSRKQPLAGGPEKNPNTRLSQTSIADYFNALNALLVKNPPYASDSTVLARFALMGIGAGKTFDLGVFSPSVREQIAAYPPKSIQETAAQMASVGSTESDRPMLGRFGTNYDKRYYYVFGGIGSNVEDDAIYIWLSKDQNDSTLSGTRRYVVRFEKGQLPPARAFWSLTLYDKNFYLAKDVPLDRHVVGSNTGMKLGADGSLEIYVQPDSPGAEKESNWLPTPKEEFFTVLRIYWPEQRMLDRQWTQPPIRLVQ